MRRVNELKAVVPVTVEQSFRHFANNVFNQVDALIKAVGK